MADPSDTFELSLLHLQYLLQSGDLTAALSRIEKLSKDVEGQGSDVYQSTQLAIVKTRLFAQAGWSERGFSVAMRAASLAQRAGLVPAVWEAVGCICDVLVNAEEYGSAVSLLDAVIPQVCTAGLV